MTLLILDCGAALLILGGALPLLDSLALLPAGVGALPLLPGAADLQEIISLHESQPNAIKTQRKARNAQSWCVELCLYGVATL